MVKLNCVNPFLHNVPFPSPLKKRGSKGNIWEKELIMNANFRVPWFQFFYVKWNLEAMCVFQINWFSVILTTVKFYFVSVGEFWKIFWNLDLAFVLEVKIPNSLRLHLSVNQFLFFLLASGAQVRRKDRYRKDKRKRRLWFQSFEFIWEKHNQI